MAAPAQNRRRTRRQRRPARRRPWRPRTRPGRCLRLREPMRTFAVSPSRPAYRRYPPQNVSDAPHLPGLGPDDQPDVVPSVPSFVVEVTRSAKRRKTVGAQLVGGVLRIALPSWMNKAEEAHWVREM